MYDTQSTFKAIADPTRRAIIGMVADREMTIGEVTDRFNMSRPAIAKHLRVLRDGGLVSVRESGRERFIKFEPSALKDVEQWIEHFSHFWDDKLSKLKAAVEKDEA
ncbi:MAG: winged helix-turn-helix transcriptional regulator [Kordiimonadaceae bacterium]|nr:winged helix-turn-helix transcriptional regulator [Kordiimonadaceae bacterium]